MGLKRAGPHGKRCQLSQNKRTGAAALCASCIHLAWWWSANLLSFLSKSICWASAVCPLTTENLAVRARLKGYEEQTQKLNILATKKKRARSVSGSHRRMVLWIMFVTVTPSEGGWLSSANNLTLRRARQSHAYPYTVQLSSGFSVFLCDREKNVCVCVCVYARVCKYVWAPHSSSACQGQKIAKTGVRPVWLGIEPGFSGKAASSLTHWTISPPPWCMPHVFWAPRSLIEITS